MVPSDNNFFIRFYERTTISSLSTAKDGTGKPQSEPQNTCILAKEQVAVSRSWEETPVISVL